MKLHQESRGRSLRTLPRRAARPRGSLPPEVHAMHQTTPWQFCDRPASSCLHACCKSMDLAEPQACCLQQSETQVSKNFPPAAFAGRQARAPAAAADKRGGRGTGRGRGRAGAAAAKPAPARPAAGRGRGGPKAKQQKVHMTTCAHLNTLLHLGICNCLTPWECLRKGPSMSMLKTKQWRN
jgi:hypothetical protein